MAQGKFIHSLLALALLVSVTAVPMMPFSKGPMGYGGMMGGYGGMMGMGPGFSVGSSYKGGSYNGEEDSMMMETFPRKKA